MSLLAIVDFRFLNSGMSMGCAGDRDRRKGVIRTYQSA
jgi:hypothetical protein